MSQPAPKLDRIHGFDALRVLVAFLIFVFHVAHVFDADPTGSIKNAETSLGATLFAVFGVPWSMPLFFFLAGVGTWLSLRSGRRTPKDFVRERTARLVLPLAFGTIFLVPWNGYLSAKNHRTFEGSFWSWLPVHVERTIESLRVPEHQGLISLYYTSWHLWFLGYLFVFTLVALPLRRLGGLPQGQRLAAWLGERAEGRFGVALLAVPFLLLRCGSGALGMPHYESGARTLSYFLYFVLGWFMMSDRRFLDAMRRQAKVWMGIGVLSTMLVMASYPLGYLETWLRRPTPSVDYAIGEGLWGLLMFSCAIGLIGCALRWTRAPGPVLRYASGVTLPFYMLHQVVLFTFAATIVEWQLGVGAKMILVAATTFVTTMALYELVIRRSPLVRPLFGLKGTRPAQRDSVARLETPPGALGSQGAAQSM